MAVYVLVHSCAHLLLAAKKLLVGAGAAALRHHVDVLSSLGLVLTYSTLSVWTLLTISF